MAEVYAVASGKGGVGKTTTAATLGAVLAEAGFEVVVVDGDLGMPDLADLVDVDDTDPTLHDVLAADAGIRDAIHPGPAGLHIVPGSQSMEAFAGGDPAGLREAIEELDAFDYVILDTGAGLSHDSVLPLALADAVFLVSTPDGPALQDAARTRHVANRLGGRTVGVILTRVGPDGPDEERVRRILDLPILGEVPEDGAVRAALEAREPVSLHAPASDAASAYRGLASELTGQEIPEPDATAAEADAAADAEAEDVDAVDAPDDPGADDDEDARADSGARDDADAPEAGAEEPEADPVAAPAPDEPLDLDDAEDDPGEERTDAGDDGDESAGDGVDDAPAEDDSGGMGAVEELADAVESSPDEEVDPLAPDEAEPAGAEDRPADVDEPDTDESDAEEPDAEEPDADEPVVGDSPSDDSPGTVAADDQADEEDVVEADEDVVEADTAAEADDDVDEAVDGADGSDEGADESDEATDGAVEVDAEAGDGAEEVDDAGVPEAAEADAGITEGDEVDAGVAGDDDTGAEADSDADETDETDETDDADAPAEVGDDDADGEDAADVDTEDTDEVDAEDADEVDAEDADGADETDEADDASGDDGLSVEDDELLESEEDPLVEHAEDDAGEVAIPGAEDDEGVYDTDLVEGAESDGHEDDDEGKGFLRRLFGG